MAGHPTDIHGPHARDGHAGDRSASDGRGDAFAPAPDLFDAPKTIRPHDESDGDSDRPASLGVERLLGFALTATALGAAFKFSTTLLFVLPFIGVALSLVTRSKRGRPIGYVICASAFLAQMTSIFITPFTWPLRFGFFLALSGAFVAFIRAQLRHLS